MTKTLSRRSCCITVVTALLESARRTATSPIMDSVRGGKELHNAQGLASGRSSEVMCGHLELLALEVEKGYFL